MFGVLMALASSIAWSVQEASPAAQPATPPSQADFGALAKLLYYLLILLGVFLFGSYAILRASRRFTQSLSAPRSGRSDASDVWAMHKVPENLQLEDEISETDDDSPDGGDEGNDGN